MKKYSFSFLVGLVLIFLLVYWLHERRAQQSSGRPFVQSQSTPYHSNDITPPSGYPYQVGVPNLVRTNFPHLTQEQKLAASTNYMNVPISFYGRVVDQAGNPLAGVHVTLSIRQWEYVPPLGLKSIFPQTELITDGDGRFQSTGGQGDDLRIETLEKQDYEVEPNSLRGFGFTTSTPFSSDPNHLVEFRMWKSEARQVLITGDKFLPINPDGRVYTMDLVKGILTPGEGEGDFRITIKRPPNAEWGKKYDWSFDLAAVNGGLKEETDGYALMFLASADGYEPDFAMSFESGNENWSNLVRKRFYLTSRNGQVYARMDVEIYSFYLKDEQGRFGVKYAANTNGNRALH